MVGMKLGTVSLIALTVGFAACNRATPDKMSFFVTSRPTGDGGNIGGLAAADAHCTALAEAAGSKGRTWRAYLSTGAEGGQPVINARERIGKGPWFNSRGELIAGNLDDLHAETRLGRTTVLMEHAECKPFPHDILTGSNPDGTLAEGDMTCRNWTSTTGYAMLGHSDRAGNRGRGNSWNSAHQSEGCTRAAFGETGGGGRSGPP
ncbi:MAG: lectin [Acidimicrobiia bacterium]